MPTPLAGGFALSDQGSLRPRNETGKVHRVRWSLGGLFRSAANCIDGVQPQAPVALELSFVEELVGSRLVRKSLVRRCVLYDVRRFISGHARLEVEKDAVGRARVHRGIDDMGHPPMEPGTRGGTL